MGKNNKMKGGNNFKDFNDFKNFLDKFKEKSNIINNINDKLKDYDSNFKEKYKIFLIYGLSFLIKNFKSDNLGPSSKSISSNGGAHDGDGAGARDVAARAVTLSTPLPKRDISGDPARAVTLSTPLPERDISGDPTREDARNRIRPAMNMLVAAEAFRNIDLTEESREGQDYLIEGDLSYLDDNDKRFISDIMDYNNIYEIYNNLYKINLIKNLFELVKIDFSTIHNIEQLYIGGTINEYNDPNMQEITNKKNVNGIHNNLLVFMNFLLYLHPTMKHDDFIKTFTIIIYILSIFIDNFEFKKDTIQSNLFTNTLADTINAFKLNYVKQIYEEILNV
jgi:hypothetical protein